MRQGEKATYNGYQVALFPLDYLYCTQISEPGAFTHCCGHATDWVGPTGSYPYYAPFDCTKVLQDDITVAWQSNNEVWTPQGLKRVIVAFTHDNAPPTFSTAKQGEYIGSTGTAGFVTGDHVHLEQSFNSTAQWSDSGLICGSGRPCYEMVGGVEPVDCYYLTGSETIVNLLGQSFKTWQDSPISDVRAWLLAAMKKRQVVKHKERNRQK